MKNNFNISDFGRLLKENKKKYAVLLGVTFVVATVIAFSLPKVYTSSVTLAPEFSSNGLSLGGNMGALASMAGINVGQLGGNDDALYPDLYPEIVGSTDFLDELLAVQVTTDDATLTTTLEDYMQNYQQHPWWGGALSWMKKLGNDNEQFKGAPDPKRISKERLDLFETLSDNIAVKLDAKTSIIDISVTMQDPYIAACLVDTVSSRLQSYIFLYRTKKAKQDLNYLLGLQEEAHQAYVSASKEYADYVESHQNVFLERFKTQAEYLENEMSTKYQVYNQFTQQVAMAQAKVQARTPVYNVLQPSYVPIKKSAPKRMLTIFLYEFIVFCGYSVYLVLKSR